eukprot:CAMPEP_0172601726 /NCGR_PEP_ID=MMETSP1068-20121228/21906_1 /TAXON_ID=35684 /ORGANISM="Pseudopedinella elastica, Strain CCMP716" /LENGTH=45 /DNA_ID= /DNA_START= /DNA_END= /DNA_ORIENTATION=
MKAALKRRHSEKHEKGGEEGGGSSDQNAPALTGMLGFDVEFGFVS